ncbi:hypothetical protein Poly51_10140 [Rubripirellula tenax]|uniref:Uncharacterized protein n=1 Tax=Rubripirellula tenax TaxID=2528015 RepID=A0A5C6FJF8_9BACT|nr:hypothetical protein Poly51_10140 [Rubripirellula tenax]
MPLASPKMSLYLSASLTPVARRQDLERGINVSESQLK